MRTSSLPFIAMLMAALPSCGQASQIQSKAVAPLEVTFAYSAVRSDTIPGGCGCLWMQGGNAEFRAAFSSRIGFVGEIAGHHASNIDSAHEDISLVSYLFGPRFSFRIRRFTPFAQVLIGGAHGFDAIFPNSNRSPTAPDAFAMAAGGEVNIDLSRRFAVRPFQADYILTDLPNTAANHQNSLRLGAGIVFKFPPPE